MGDAAEQRLRGVEPGMQGKKSCQTPPSMRADGVTAAIQREFHFCDFEGAQQRHGPVRRIPGVHLLAFPLGVGNTQGRPRLSRAGSRAAQRGRCFTLDPAWRTPQAGLRSSIIFLVALQRRSRSARCSAADWLTRGTLERCVERILRGAAVVRDVDAGFDLLLAARYQWSQAQHTRGYDEPPCGETPVDGRFYSNDVTSSPASRTKRPLRIKEMRIPHGATFPLRIPAYMAVYPPSTMNSAPVAYDDASESRNATMLAISPGSPFRLIG